ncbi:MAG: Methionyl-tRNA formyltransferase [bacterium ADurb.Bin212]|nr:MAG: Methionyl-tRNA formyltransferase [bacterium ADurb.Bin212]
MKRDIITDPNPILREPAQPVESFDMELQCTVDDMIDTMRNGNGIGLAAPQIGVSKQIIVCELDEGEEQSKIKKDSPYQPFPLTVICNPQITMASKSKRKMVEGCLSFPGFEIVVSRPKEVTLKGKDRYGSDIEIRADKLFARVLQHEFDHLNSTLLIDHLKQIDVVLFAGGDFALKTLEFLHTDRQYNIKAVVTTKQTSKTRGLEVDNNNVKKLAKKFGLKVIEIETLKTTETQDTLKKINADLGVVVDFGLIIPNTITELFQYKIINIHPSILPKYRGSSPIQSTILNGDKYAGITIMLINEKMDAGPILAQYKVKLKGRETYPILKEYLAELGASLLLDTIPYYITGEVKPRPQRESRAIYCNTINKSDGEVTEQTDPVMVDRMIRAYQPWPGVYTIRGDLRVQIVSAHLDKDKHLILETVKPAGKKEMSYQDFINGYRQELTFGENSDNI